MKLKLYNCAYVYIFFPGIHIQSGGPINDIHLNIQTPVGNGSQSNGKEIIGSCMSLYKVPSLKLWVVNGSILAPNTLKIPITSKILYLKNFKSQIQ